MRKEMMAYCMREKKGQVHLVAEPNVCQDPPRPPKVCQGTPGNAKTLRDSFHQKVPYY